MALQRSSRKETAPGGVVQADFLNGLIDDTILVQITATRHGIPSTEVEIDPTQETGSGLTKVCYASCLNLVTRDQAIIDQMLDFLTTGIVLQIEACLKTMLDLH